VKNEVKHKVHNPDNLTPKQVGVSDGYRLLDEDEIKERKLEYKEIEAWVCSCWSKEEFVGESNVMTYRTKLSREQLARLK